MADPDVVVDDVRNGFGMSAIAMRYDLQSVDIAASAELGFADESAQPQWFLACLVGSEVVRLSSIKLQRNRYRCTRR